MKFSNVALVLLVGACSSEDNTQNEGDAGDAAVAMDAVADVSPQDAGAPDVNADASVGDAQPDAVAFDAKADVTIADAKSDVVVVDATADVVAIVDASQEAAVVDASPDAAIIDASGDGGVVMAPPGSKRVFVTAGTYSANLQLVGRLTADAGTNGPQGADNLCAKEAQIAGIGGTWKAWINDSSFGSGALRVGVHGPWARMDGALVFAGKTVYGNPVVPINITSLGTAVLSTSSYSVFSALADDGTAKGGSVDCYQWTSSSSGHDVSYGNCTKTSNWSSTGTAYCSTLGRLYCFEQ